MSYYGYQQPQYMGVDENVRRLVLAKLTDGLVFASITILVSILFGLNPIFYVLAIIGYIVSIIGYFFAKNENTINNLYFIFVGSSSVFLGLTLSLVLTIPGGATIIAGAFAGTTAVVGFIWYKVNTEHPDPAYVGRNIRTYSIIFIVMLIAGWIIAFGSVFYLILSVFGAALFSLYFYYDLARVTRGQVYSISKAAWSLYWDILLIFRYILQILIMLTAGSRRD